jgi:hypothetical protein
MNSRYLNARIPYLLHLLLEFGSGCVLGLFFHPALQIPV